MFATDNIKAIYRTLTGKGNFVAQPVIVSEAVQPLTAFEIGAIYGGYFSAPHLATRYVWTSGDQRIADYRDRMGMTNAQVVAEFESGVAYTLGYESREVKSVSFVSSVVFE
jgi:hypothetical protein